MRKTIVRRRFHFLSTVGLFATTFLFVLTTFASGTKDRIELSSEEMAWLKAHPVILHAPDPDYAPFEFKDKPDHYAGIAPDFLKLVGEKLGVEFKAVPNTSWAVSLENVKQHKADLVTVATKTAERSRYMIFTSPYIEFPNVILMREDVSGSFSLENLKGKKMAVIKGWAITTYIQKTYPEIKLCWVENVKAALEAVSNGTTDAVLLNRATAGYWRAKTDIANLRIAGETSYIYKLSFASRRDWPQLSKLLEKAFNAISESERKEIVDRWIFPFERQWRPGPRFWIGLAGLIVLLLIAGSFAWNLSLQRKVQIQTRDLQTELAERKRAEEALAKAHDELERKVQDRTAQLKRAKEAVEAASKAKSLFVANMSHELRTPLNGIIVSVDLALRQELSPKVERIQKTISRSSQALLRTVNTILDFSKSEDGKLELAAIPFRLDEVLGKLSGTFVQKGAQKQIKISFDIPADEVSNALIGDPDRLVEVFNHLLDNAAKFSTNIPKAVIGVRDVGPSAKKTTLEFYVKDNGIGIASEDFKKIFDAFTQVDPSSTRQYDGTGMGLAVSKRLVERMGGTIRVESELGKGSIFYFTAPFGRQDQEHPFKAPSFKDREDTTVNLMSSKPGGKMGSLEFLLELLSTIDPLIQKRKPKPCKEIMAEISKYAWPDEYAQEIVELDQLIGKYKFKDAYTILESIVKKLKSSIS